MQLNEEMRWAVRGAMLNGYGTRTRDAMNQRRTKARPRSTIPGSYVTLSHARMHMLHTPPTERPNARSCGPVGPQT